MWADGTADEGGGLAEAELANAAAKAYTQAGTHAHAHECAYINVHARLLHARLLHARLLHAYMLHAHMCAHAGGD